MNHDQPAQVLFRCDAHIFPYRILSFTRISTRCECILLRSNRIMKILMVCLGNICRSPLAEGIMRDRIEKAGLSWTVESAGTNGYHVGEAPHKLSQKVARLNGIDICHQRARRFTAADFKKYDKIYAMAGDVLDEMRWIARSSYDQSKVDLLLNEVYPGKDLDVPDPWYGPEPGYHEVYTMIDKACSRIIEKYSNGII